MRGPGWFVAALIVASGTWGSAAQQRPPAAPPRGVVEVPVAPPPPPPPTGVIAGRITDVIAKTPIPRARVILSAGCEAHAAPAGPPCTPVLAQNRVVLTGEDGRFRLTELPVGTTFVLRAAATGYAPSAYGELPPGTRPAFITLAQAQVVETANIELAPEVVLSGTVLDEDGKAFNGAFVEARRATYAEGRRELITVTEAVTDDRGQFRLTQMPPGQYFVSAFDPAFANVGDAAGQLFYSPTFYPAAATPEEATRITLDPGVSREAIQIRLKLIKPSRIGGFLKPTMQLPLTAGAIELGPKRNDQYASLSNYRVDIHPDGSYMFANVPPGRYVIRARGETESELASMFGMFTIDISGSDRTTVNISMSPGAIVSGFVEWERKGRARIPADRQTMVVRAPMPDGSMSGDAPTGNIQPDDTFLLRGVLQGEHYIRVENLPAPWALKRIELQGADVTDTAITFTYGQRAEGLRVILTDNTTELFGSIVPRRGDVLHGYAVVAFSVNPQFWIPQSRHVKLARPVDAQGHYRIEGLPAGDYYLAVTRDVDEADISNKKYLQMLADSPTKRRVQLTETERKLVDLQPIVRKL